MLVAEKPEQEQFLSSFSFPFFALPDDELLQKHGKVRNIEESGGLVCS